MGDGWRCWICRGNGGESNVPRFRLFGFPPMKKQMIKLGSWQHDGVTTPYLVR